MNATLVNHPIVLSLGWTLIHSLWIGLTFALIIRIAWCWISPSKAQWRYRLALAALFGTLTASLFVFGQYFQQYQTLYGLAPKEEAGAIEVLALYPSVAIWSETSMRSIELFIHQLESFFPLLVFAWLLGTVFMSFRLTGSWWYVSRLERKGLIHPDEHWHHLFSELCTKMGIDQKVRLYWSDRVLEPITLRHWKPIILFPIGLANQLSMEQVEVILLHELSHIKRWDYLVNWLQSVLELLFFFHPAVWWLSAQVRTAREHCCDDLVLQANQQQRLLYARTLTQVSAYSLNSKTQLAMSLNGNNKEFTARIKRLFGQLESNFDWRKPLLSGLLVLFMLSVGLFYSPELTAHEISVPLQEVRIDSIPAEKKPSPLFVIDGVIQEDNEVRLNEIDPDDIATISVLKDEAALEKYGTQGQHGVIEIELKKKKSKASTRSDTILLWEAILPTEGKEVPLPKAKSQRQILADGFQVFPNPFEDQIEVKYQLAEKQSTSLQVFDALGQLVHVLAPNAERIGAQSARWDASEMPAGTYTIILQAGNIKVSKSVVKK
ncbi:MAG: M56 family metallopeptidase [Bacteroidota bacterium]